jgi:hypothetical protein
LSHLDVGHQMMLDAAGPLGRLAAAGHQMMLDAAGALGRLDAAGHQRRVGAAGPLAAATHQKKLGAAGPLGRFAATGPHRSLAATGQMRRLAGDGHDAPLSAPAAMLPCGLPERRWSPCFLHVAAAGRPVQPVPQARELQARGNTPAKDSPARELGLGRIGVGFGCRRFAAGVRPFSRRLFLRLPFALCWSGVFFYP